MTNDGAQMTRENYIQKRRWNTEGGLMGQMQLLESPNTELTLTVILIYFKRFLMVANRRLKPYTNLLRTKAQ